MTVQWAVGAPCGGHTQPGSQAKLTALTGRPATSDSIARPHGPLGWMVPHEFKEKIGRGLLLLFLDLDFPAELPGGQSGSDIVDPVTPTH